MKETIEIEKELINLVRPTTEHQGTVESRQLPTMHQSSAAGPKAPHPRQGISIWGARDRRKRVFLLRERKSARAKGS